MTNLIHTLHIARRLADEGHASSKTLSDIDSAIRSIEELISAVRPFALAFPLDLDWYRRRHDLNVLADMLSLPVPITPEDIALLHQALGEEPDEDGKRTEIPGEVML